MIRLPLVLVRPLVVAVSAVLVTVGASLSAAQPAPNAGPNALEGLEVR